METMIVLGSVVAGVALVVAGVAMWSVPAAFIVAGIALATFGVSFEFDGSE